MFSKHVQGQNMGNVNMGQMQQNPNNQMVMQQQQPQQQQQPHRVNQVTQMQVIISFNLLPEQCFFDFALISLTL